MCVMCRNNQNSSDNVADYHHSRRKILIAASLLSIAGLMGTSSTVKAQNTPPKPDNVLTPDEAIKRLLAGNERYVKATTLQVNVSETRGVLSKGQNPYACILSCADSRISPELCFDEERGDLFVARVAGNFVNTDILASFEYAIAVLNAPLILVLGHTSCGAIDAAIKAYTQNTAFPGHIQALTTSLAPAVKIASQQVKGNELLAATTVENVRLNVTKLTESNPIISERIKQGKLKVVGGIYDLTTGVVKLV